MEDDYSTKVKCNITACKYNSSCCIKSKGEHFCLKDDICIDLNSDDRKSFEFTCTSFENGQKYLQCILCEVLANRK